MLKRKPADQTHRRSAHAYVLVCASALSVCIAHQIMSLTLSKGGITYDYHKLDSAPASVKGFLGGEGNYFTFLASAHLLATYSDQDQWSSLRTAHFCKHGVTRLVLPVTSFL